LEQAADKKENAHPSHFLKFILSGRTSGTFGFACVLSEHTKNKTDFLRILTNYKF